MSDEPIVQIEVKCGVCGWPLRNLGHKYEHIQPLAPDDHHKPEPVIG